MDYLGERRGWLDDIMVMIVPGDWLEWRDGLSALAFKNSGRGNKGAEHEAMARLKKTHLKAATSVKP
ncbi:hypothetical protein MAPG_04861 [Magnaporthiopsis poae ATCC 64411]|uniref:Uncharacterized protein n=1 Tax=Magnaporthiopsis poae (strain ATCC 64411 / 73-15) TaxID=644358 RepID=A0A0C4DXV4_MAGP6|nr:hypothetical protein MAPG_04861 [Magnaporthiopsis poae ATCC 64411]